MRIASGLLLLAAGLSLFVACKEEKVPCRVMDGGVMRICNHLVSEGDKSLDCTGWHEIEYSCIEKLSSLESAHFLETEVSDFRLLARNKNLKYLGMNSPDLKSLAGIAVFPKLEELVIGGSGVTDLKPLLALKKLKYLNISETDIDDISPLMEMTSLRMLVAVKTPVTKEQLERLRRTLPKVETFVLHPDEYIHFPQGGDTEKD